MTWEALSEIQSYAARHLIDQRDEKLYRTACTRAYYSAYAAITARVPPGTVFAHGWQNPALQRCRDMLIRLQGSLGQRKTRFVSPSPNCGSVVRMRITVRASW